MKYLISIFAILLITHTLQANEQSIIMKGVTEEQVEANDIVVIEKYFGVINKELKKLNAKAVKSKCIDCKDNVTNPSTIGSDTLIYINEWLRYPGLCNIQINRLHKETKKMCHKRARKTFKDTIKYIEIAAKEFDLNPNHLACLLLQESQFLSNSASGTGPSGLAQYSTGTLQTKKNIFKSTMPKTCTKSLKEDCTKLKSKSRKAECRKSLIYCRQKSVLVSKKKNIGSHWENYATKINKTLPKEKKVNVKKFCKNDCRKNPFWSIGAAALYLKEIKDYDLKELQKKASNDKEVFLMALGLYNPGPGLKNKMLKPIAKHTFTKGWEKRIPQVFKNRNNGEILSIDNYYIFKNKKLVKIKTLKSYKNGTFKKTTIFNTRHQAIKIKNISDEPKGYIKRVRRCIDYKLGDKILKS